MRILFDLDLEAVKEGSPRRLANLTQGHFVQELWDFQLSTRSKIHDLPRKAGATGMARLLGCEELEPDRLPNIVVEPLDIEPPWVLVCS